jgi:hypothetical protein
VHVPGAVETAHDWHVPVHAVRQQTPCAQMPVAHSLPSLQAPPGDLRPHEPLLHTEGETQSASAVHVPLQAEAPHLYGAQEDAAGVTQAPAPSQAAAGV